MKIKLFLKLGKKNSLKGFWFIDISLIPILWIFWHVDFIYSEDIWWFCFLRKKFDDKTVSFI